MIYLIGGAPRVGKSQLLQKFIEQRTMPAISCDFLYDTDQVKNLKGFLGASIIEKGELFYPTLQQLLVNASLRSENVIVEGEVILPRHVVELSKHYEIKACFMGFSKVSLEQILEFGGFFNWVQYKLDHNRQPEVADLAKRTVERSDIIRTECEKYELPYFDMSGDYITAQQRILDYLLSR